jgi:hypothetical protein
VVAVLHQQQTATQQTGTQQSSMLVHALGGSEPPAQQSGVRVHAHGSGAGRAPAAGHSSRRGGGQQAVPGEARTARGRWWGCSTCTHESGVRVHAHDGSGQLAHSSLACVCQHMVVVLDVPPQLVTAADVVAGNQLFQVRGAHGGAALALADSTLPCLCVHVVVIIQLHTAVWHAGARTEVR